MGCFHSKESVVDAQPPSNRREAPTKQYHKPKWRSQEQLTAVRLQEMREEFWDTQAYKEEEEKPHYGGSKVIWDAIKAAIEASDMDTTRLIIETAGVIVAKSNMTVMYDERGAKYELPKYVLADPTNLVISSPEMQQQQQQQQQHTQLQQPGLTQEQQAASSHV